MKKKLALLLLVIACYVVNAQNPNACPPDVVIIDTTYPYYLFDRPCPREGYFISTDESEFDSSHDSIEYRGVRYYSSEPIMVYGIAHLGFIGSHYTVAVAKMEQDSLLYYVASKPAHNCLESLYPHIYLPSGYDNNLQQMFSCYPVHEEYFETPVLVKDTFYVGIVRDYSIMFHTGAFPFGVTDTFGRHPCPENLLFYGYGKTFHPDLLNCNKFWGGFFPIIHPYEDSLVCDPVKNFHLVQRGPSYPTFAWDTSSQLEQEWFQLQYAPYGSGNWRTVETSEPSLRVVASFDPSIYYQARIRAVCHHVCPGHDTVLYSTWSDTIRFYTGSTEPTDITLVEGRADLFTLMPNPARGEVTVELGGSVDGKGVLTLTDGLGREVLWQSAVNGQQSVVSISLKEFPSGVYFVTLRTEKYTATRKLVVEN